MAQRVEHIRNLAGLSSAKEFAFHAFGTEW